MNMTRAREVTFQKLRANFLQMLSDQLHLNRVINSLSDDLLNTTFGGLGKEVCG